MTFIRHKEGVKDQFFVVLREGGDLFKSFVEEVEKREGISILYNYFPESASVALRMNEEQARELSEDPRVLLVEQDQPLLFPEDYEPPRRKPTPPSPRVKVSSMGWGLDRIDLRPGNGTYDSPNKGEGVTVFVLDSGISTGYREDIFGDRVREGYSSVGKSCDTSDCTTMGHGTAVASVIGGRRFGVARRVQIVPVRVWCTSEGSIASMVAGVRYVYRHAVPPAVMNISLVSPRSECLEDWVRRAITERGITCVVAAGNAQDGNPPVDVRGVTPARVGEAITVAASDDLNGVWSGSNFGRGVDLFAPGFQISSFSGQGIPSNDFTGTSFATGFVSGAAAIYLSAHRGALPCDVQRMLVSAARSVIVNPGVSPNRLLQLVV